MYSVLKLSGIFSNPHLRCTKYKLQIYTLSKFIEDNYFSCFKYFQCMVHGPYNRLNKHRLALNCLHTGDMIKLNWNRTNLRDNSKKKSIYLFFDGLKDKCQILIL